MIGWIRSRNIIVSKLDRRDNTAILDCNQTYILIAEQVFTRIKPTAIYAVQWKQLQITFFAKTFIDTQLASES